MQQRGDYCSHLIKHTFPYKNKLDVPFSAHLTSPILEIKHTYNLSNQAGQVSTSQVQDQPGLHSENKAILHNRASPVSKEKKN